MMADEEVNVGGDQDGLQRSQPASMGDSVSRDEDLNGARGGTMDGTRAQISEMMGGLQNGDNDTSQAEGSSEDARASSVSRSPATARRSSEKAAESSVDRETTINLGEQPDQSNRDGGSGELPGIAESEATRAMKDTSQGGGPQKEESQLQAKSDLPSQVTSSRDKISCIDNRDIMTGEEYKATIHVNKAESDLNTDQDGRSQKSNDSGCIVKGESKKEQTMAEREPDSPAGGTSQEHEITSAAQSTNESSGSPDNDHLGENGSEQQPRNIASKSPKIKSRVEMESACGDPRQVPSSAVQPTATAAKNAINETVPVKMESEEQPALSSGESEATNINSNLNGSPQADQSEIKSSRNFASESQKIEEMESVCGDAGQVQSKNVNKHESVQPDSPALSKGESEATNIKGTDDNRGDGNSQTDGTVFEATVLRIEVPDEKRFMFKVSREDEVIIRLIPKFDNTVDTASRTDIESESTNIAVTNEETNGVDIESESNANELYQETRASTCNMKLAFDFCLMILLAVLVCCVAWYSEGVKLGTFDLEGFFIQNPETASQWERLDRRAIRILVTGKTGTGKSALINGLIGRNVTKEGDTLDPTTSRVEQIKQMVHGISMSVFDSPGLQDGTSREQEYLQDMQQKCEKVDLVLYAIKMTDQRVHAADTKAMKKITDAFGHKFWEKAIFVMTFANEVRSPEYPDDDYENKIYFEKRLHDWIEKLPSIIEQRSDIPIKIGKRVPIIPAGYYKTRDLPGRKFWFSQFWKAALDRMMESSAEEAGYMLQFSQDRLKSYNDTTEEDFQKPIHEQPILSKIIDE